MQPNRPTIIKVAHKNSVLEAGLHSILAAIPEFDVRPLTNDHVPQGPRAQELDVAVLDQAMGVRWARGVPATGGGPRVLIVAMDEETEVQQTLQAGVHGYVMFGCSTDEIVKAARAVAAGRRYLCDSATRRMADNLMLPSLTPRESEVLALVSRGHNNKEVARSLGISLGTVKAHMRGLLSKLGARCRTEALWIASQRGLIALHTLAAPELRVSRPLPASGHWFEPKLSPGHARVAGL